MWTVYIGMKLFQVKQPLKKTMDGVCEFLPPSSVLVVQW